MRRDKMVHLSGKAEIIGSNAIKRTKQANRDLCFLECRNDLDIVHLNDSVVVHYESIFMTIQVGKTFTLTTGIRSANWHVTMDCNYKCRFCFYKNMTGKFKDIEKARHILETLKAKGIEKINFTGGEPLLYRNLDYLLKMAKDMGFIVSIVTNGALLNEERIKEMSKYVDWIGISIDSANEEIEKRVGRGYGDHVAHVRRVCELVQKYGMRLKINTTVTKLNYSEDMRPFISSLHPDRWKSFQVLYMKDQNDDALDLFITLEEFEKFKSINGVLTFDNGTAPIFESTNDMLDSYFIIGSDGNILQSNGNQRSSIPFESLEQMALTDLVDPDKYQERGGNYDWD